MFRLLHLDEDSPNWGAIMPRYKHSDHVGGSVTTSGLLKSPVPPIDLL